MTGTDLEQRDEGSIAAASHSRLDALARAPLGLPSDGRDEQELTPLYHAARNGHLDVLRELVARGASIEVRDRLYDGTLGHAQHFAARWPRPAAAEIIALLELPKSASLS